jgi:MFS family permease
MAVAAAMGALAGDLAGGALTLRLGQPAETGIMVGSALGAAMAVLLALRLASNERVRKWALAILGGAAALDTASQAALGPVLGGGYIKRLFFYLGAGAALILVKGRPSLERAKTRESVSAAVKAWLEAAVALGAALSRKVSGKAEGAPESGGEDVLARIVPGVKSLLADPAFSESPALAEIARRLSNHGFELGAQEPLAMSLVWEEGMRDRYDTFGLARAGQKVAVEEQPVIKDGKVVRKGMVVPERG